jgi:hypothetical protein
MVNALKMGVGRSIVYLAEGRASQFSIEKVRGLYYYCPRQIINLGYNMLKYRVIYESINLLSRTCFIFNVSTSGYQTP